MIDFIDAFVHAAIICYIYYGGAFLYLRIFYRIKSRIILTRTVLDVRDYDKLLDV